MLGSFKGRQVAVVGMGKSNQSLCRYLLKEGAKITCFDRKTASDLGPVYEEFAGLGADWSLGDRYLDGLSGFQSIFLTPGMKKNLPQIAEARRAGALITNEIALFLDRCRARVCGVTGSAGKTTTSTLLGMMLEASHPERPVYVGGNIGAVLIEKVDSIEADALVVLELSSFQLELVTKSPEVALVLNVSPNHLDIHDSFEDYVEAKKNIYRSQADQAWCVLNLDDAATRSMASECPGSTGFFTLDEKAAKRQFAEGHPVTWLAGKDLMARMPSGHESAIADEPVHLCGVNDILVPGHHNISNVLAAALGALIMGGSREGINRAVRSFRGVEHRIEYAGELRGVRYYNDSIATSPDRTAALLEAIAGPLVLILGGYDKGIPFDDLAEKVVARGCSAVTLGATAPKIEEALLKAGMKPRDIARAHSLEEAVKLAAAASQSGSSIALSPACASYDMFTNFEERGRAFKDIVRRLE